MFEIREYIDENGAIIKNDVIDLAEEMKMFGNILQKGQDEEEKKIKEEFLRRQKSGDEIEEGKMEEKLKLIREKFDILAINIAPKDEMNAPIDVSF